MGTADETAPVELTARVLEAGGRFVAAVDGLGLEGYGRTPTAAAEALVQAVRGWLERQDTTGKLAEVLGLDDLDEETEIVLQFIAEDAAGEDAVRDDAAADEVDKDEVDG